MFIIRLFVTKLIIDALMLEVCVHAADGEQQDFMENRLRGSRATKAGKMYLGIAAPAGDASYGRAFNRTVANMTQSFAAATGANLTLDTVVIDLPANGTFSARLLESLCGHFEGKYIVAVLIIGDSPAAFTVSLAATYSGIPMLWARGHAAFHTGFREMESKSLEVQLAPTGRELVQALRGILLQAHWHSFTVLAEAAAATTLQRPELWQSLAAAPLHPTLAPLPYPPKPQQTFRKLADISRSTRGVVVLFSNRATAVSLLDDAKKLNMMDGHFVWIWIDTGTAAGGSAIREPDAAPANEKSDQSARDQPADGRTRARRDSALGELSDMGVNYLLKNDQFLLFNHRSGVVETSKPKPSDDDVIRRKGSTTEERAPELPLGLLSLRPLPIKVDRHLVKGAVRLLVAALKMTLINGPDWLMEGIATERLVTSCWRPQRLKEFNFSAVFGRELKAACMDTLAGKKLTQEIGVDKVDKSLVSNFEILNLVPDHTSKDVDSSLNVTNAQNRSDIESGGLRWKRVGMVSGRSVRLDTIVWPGGDLSVAAISNRARSNFRIVTALAPPFVMESELDEDGQCLRGLPCHRVLTSDKDNLTLVFNEMEYKHRLEEEEEEQNMESRHDYLEDEEKFFPFQKFRYRTHCCYGLSMDLLENVAQELEFDFRLYIAADGLFGSKAVMKKNNKRSRREVGKKFLSYRFSKDDVSQIDARSRESEFEIDVKWNGVVGDLISGTAHMSFAPLSVSSARSEVIDYSVPYFYSGVSFLAAPQQRSEIPLLAFLLPFSPELWIAIFTSLNITAIAVAIYEWLSPFGLNPWGRQRSKNFSMSSALWVMWGLLCGHLVAFKAPKSWPNKFLINVWGGFSVIFVASYTANIAALIAGLFFHNTVSNYHDRSLLSQKVGAPRSSASEYYVQKANRLLWEHMHKYSLENVEDGIERLRNGSLDILIADTPILDYYRATDHGCKLQKIGDTINEDTYAIGMTKGFPLKDSISAVIAKYSSNGYMDILQEKWYGGLPCFKLQTDIAQPRPLGVAAVIGVFILLGMGMLLGLLILLVEHLFFRYTLPILREKPKGSIWRSRNIMFFSQKLYRFINCVELVSPHHAARELVHTIRQGQITSLFQKSIKRKEHEQRRRRKSKAQFFEMIQEIRSTIRRQQQEEREPQLESVTEDESEYQLSPEDKKHRSGPSPSIIRRTFMRTSPKLENTAKAAKSPTYFTKPLLFSPRSNTKAKSSSNLNVRRFSTDSVFNSQTLKLDRSAVGRRLSKDASCFLSTSPPDINSRRSSYLDIISTGNKLAGKSPVLSIENVSDASSHERKLSDSESIGKKLATLPKYKEPVDKNRLQPQYSLTLGKSDETISTSEKNSNQVAAAKSYQNISDNEISSGVMNFTPEQKSNLSDDEIARRNKLTIGQLQTQLTNSGLKPAKRRDNNANPHIKIQVEDTSANSTSKPPAVRKNKRHQSLSDNKHADPPRRTKLAEHSRSLDSNPSKEIPRSRSPRCKEHDLPPAPPPPNCSPRNSSGKSPLERLSKDELVLLWRSSESELRSHLLKAIREKEVKDPP